jgi:hypothetical protein
MLGHFRHEIGHFYWQQLVKDDLLEEFRELFGDERESYADAVQRHYDEGAPDDWETDFFAHFLHICDTVETASAYGLAPGASPRSFTTFRELVTGVWIPLSIALNQINRSMGKGALYPFVIRQPVLDKLEYVARLGQRERSAAE